MRKIIYLLLCVSSLVHGQKPVLKVGSNPFTIDPSAVLDVESTTKGFLPPRMTFAQRNDILSPTDGLIIYCTNCPSGSRMQFFSDSKWETLSVPKTDYVYDRYYGDGVHDFVYKATTITFSDNTTATWLTNNLGANYANEKSLDFFPDKQASAINDYKAYGSLFQWGRAADKHELINWATSTSGSAVIVATTTTLSNNADDPNNGGKFIINNTTPYDWRSPKNDGLWNGVSEINNPCPVGYTVPTSSDFTKLINNSIIVPTNSFDSILKLPLVGIRFENGIISSNSGIETFYWTRTTNSTEASGLYIRPISTRLDFNNTMRRALGCPIRCIKK